MAAVGTAVANSNWNTASTWSFSGVNRVPNCGDTVSIPSGRVVTVASQNDYTSCSSPIYITVGGTLQFSNGNKLQLTCNSTVNILSGGLVKKSTAGGGNSTFIEICGTVEWKAGDGDLYGPKILGGNTLPVSLLYFNAELTESNVALSWSTASEINNDYFTVQRSGDGEVFENVSTVKGSGNSTQIRYYNFSDEKPYSGLNYYRLKQTDFDGKYSYSSLVAVNFSRRTILEVLAVSSDASSLKLLLNDPASGRRRVQILRLDGKTVSETYIETEKGTRSYEIPGSFLSEGVCTVLVQAGTDISTKKFISN